MKTDLSDLLRHLSSLQQQFDSKKTALLQTSVPTLSEKSTLVYLETLLTPPRYEDSSLSRYFDNNKFTFSEHDLIITLSSEQLTLALSHMSKQFMSPAVKKLYKTQKQRMDAYEEAHPPAF